MTLDSKVPTVCYFISTGSWTRAVLYVPEQACKTVNCWQAILCNFQLVTSVRACK